MERQWELNYGIDMENFSMENAVYMDEISYMDKGRMRAIRSLLTEFVMDANVENEEPTLAEKISYINTLSVKQAIAKMNEVMANMPKHVEKKQSKK